MQDDVAPTGDRQLINYDEDQLVELNPAGSNVTPSRPVVLDPPICDEQEWHRF